MKSSDRTKIQITAHNETAVVTFTSPCVSDSDEITQASERIQAYITQHHPPRILFDFAQVKFFTSQVLGLILEARARLKSSQGRVMISAINPQLHRVFRITNLDRILEFFPDRQSAVQSTGIP